MAKITDSQCKGAKFDPGQEQDMAQLEIPQAALMIEDLACSN